MENNYKFLMLLYYLLEPYYSFKKFFEEKKDVEEDSMDKVIEYFEY